MHPGLRILGLVLTSLALVVGPLALPAGADDFYIDDSFVVDAIQVDRPTVTVLGLATTPATITMRTRPAPGVTSVTGDGDDYLTLAESPWPHERKMLVPLRRVATDGDVTTWQGVAQIAGPSRTLSFAAVHNCLVRHDLGQERCRSFLYPQWVTAPTIRVTAVDPPVIAVDKGKAVDLSARAYMLSGRVTTTGGRSYGRSLTLVLGRGLECRRPGRGLVVRTGTDGRFRLLVTNRDRASVGDGAPRVHDHCLRLAGPDRDSAGVPAALATTTTTLPWTTTLRMNAPVTATVGRQVVFWSRPTRLSSWTSVHLERLHGRSAWRRVDSAYVHPTGRIQVWLTPTRAGREIYRVRAAGTTVTSAPFAVTAR